MGQQQLLLVILVTIIVGIATVVAINIFGSSAEQANEDAVRQDMVTIAAQAQGWYTRPEMLGGGGNKFTGFDFTKIGFGCDELSNSDLRCDNANGGFTVTVSDTALVLVAVPSTAPTSLTTTIGPRSLTNIAPVVD